MGIIADFCSAYRAEIKNQIDMEMINKMINNLKSQINKAEYDRFITLIEYVKKIIYDNLFNYLIFRELRMRLDSSIK